MGIYDWSYQAGLKYGCEQHFVQLGSVATATVTALSESLANVHLIDLLTAPDMGFSTPASSLGLLAGAVPCAKTIIDGLQQITLQLLVLGYATSKAILPDHKGVVVPTDWLSVLTWLYPIPFKRLEPYHSLNSKTAKSMVAGLQHDATQTKLKLLELECLLPTVVVQSHRLTVTQPDQSYDVFYDDDIDKYSFGISDPYYPLFSSPKSCKLWPPEVAREMLKLQGPEALASWQLFPSSLAKMAEWADVYKDTESKDPSRNHILIYKNIPNMAPDTVFPVAIRLQGLLRQFRVDRFGNWTGRDTDIHQVVQHATLSSGGNKKAWDTTVTLINLACEYEFQMTKIYTYNNVHSSRIIPASQMQAMNLDDKASKCKRKVASPTVEKPTKKHHTILNFDVA
ncbi:hypothetical protein EDB19DRAFT_1964547 [Suillus lakei]|nr:hypothetical protein EDB19DRAFT_1964547 [Suillus lakei]